MRTPLRVRILPLLILCFFIANSALPVLAQEKSEKQQPTTPPAAQSSPSREAILAEMAAANAAKNNGPSLNAELEAKFAKSLSGATLEGSYTLNGPGADVSKLRKEKYTLGEVKKLGGNMWMFPARIQYGGKDVTLPIPLPVEWAGDTPVIVVDNVTLPGFGTVSARVLFFDGHYAGYWKHGDHSGNLFGEYHPAGEKRDTEKADVEKASKDAPAPSSSYPAAEKQSK